MNFDDVLSNKPMPVPLREKLGTVLEKEDKILFAVTGDLKLDAVYGDCALVALGNGLVCVEDSGCGSFLISYSDIKEISVKRMYSNAVLLVNGRVILRFSFKSVSFMEAAVEAIKKICKGEDAGRATETVAAVFEKQRLTCPKCGRPLSSSGAECINCMSKGKLVKRLAYYIKPHTLTLIVCILLSGLTTAAALVPPYITKTLVDKVIPESNLRLLYILVSVLLGVYVVQAVIGTVKSHFLRITGDKIVTSLRNDVYERAQYLPVSFYDKTSTGSMFSRISGDTNNLNSFMLRITQEAVVQFFLMIGIMAVMLVLNWKLALLSLIPVPVVALGARFFGKKIQPVYRRIWVRWSSVCGILSDSLPGIRVIKSFTGERRSIKKFKDYNNMWYNEDKNASILASIFPQTVNFFILCGTLVIWGIGGYNVVTHSGGMTAGMLISFISYASMFYGPINFFAGLSDSYQSALTSAERLLDILDAEPEKDFGKGNKVGALKGKIEFKNVSFSFDKTEKTLDNINLTVEPGDVVGIVGTTGSGKSTLINLLMRFYDDYEGEISVDGKNIRDIDLGSYRSQIGFVQQEPLMFRDTVFNNIAFSNPELPVEAVINAADIANAHNFIARMPDAYDTVLGERGAGLSGGERQRISIARAVIKNPSMLIFDEATAAVDSETEHLIQEAIERLISGRTTLMIAHRLSTLKKANKIVVVDKGKIIECGTPAELMKLKGKYYKLVEIQNMSEEAQRRSSEEGFS